MAGTPNGADGLTIAMAARDAAVETTFRRSIDMSTFSREAGGKQTPRLSHWQLPLALVVVLSCATIACASKGDSPRGSGSVPDLLTEQQLLDTRADDLLSAIRRTRPNWLHVRATEVKRSSGGGGLAPRAADEVPVYLDGAKYGAASVVLQNIPVRHVAEIRYLNAIDATTRFGIGHGAGAILVQTKR